MIQTAKQQADFKRPQMMKRQSRDDEPKIPSNIVKSNQQPNNKK